MATRPRGVLLTYSDYLELPDDGKRYELFEGELQVTPAPSTGHQSTSMTLSIVLGNHVRSHGLGKVLAAPCDVLLSELTVLQPDLLFVAKNRLEIVRDRYVSEPPDLVIEILSPTTAGRDRQSKRQLYAQYGAPNYWLVDPSSREVRAEVLVENGYRQVALARGDEPFTAPPFPDLVIPLSELWV